MTEVPEKRAIISGIGISDVGRRLGVPAVDLTASASRQAIADAGLEPSDIDGIATMGDTPVDEAAAVLGIEPSFRGGGFDTGGLLSPVMSAFLAVAEGRARHVLVYRTVQMVGGTVLPPPSDDGAASPSPAEAARMAAVMGDMGPLLAAHAYSAANWLAMHCRRHMYLYGTTKEQLGWLAVNSRSSEAANNNLIASRTST